MKTRSSIPSSFPAVLLSAFCFLLSPSSLHAAPPLNEPIIPADPDAAGRELVARLLSLQPQEGSTNDAVLRIRTSRTNQFEVPLRICVSVTASNWSTDYRTHGTNKEHAAAFTVIHTPGSPNIYRVTRFSRPPSDNNECATLSGAEAFIPFAGSDYWLADLGMEFLHWPAQRLVRKEICRGQSCDRLESSAPAGWTNGYVRVVSWFDIDTGGPVLVEAYDAKGKMVKEFKPNDFKKINGQWQVEELEMNNRRTGSRSILRFLLNKP